MPHQPPSSFAQNARSAGLLYLGIIILGVSSEAALRAPLINWSDASATAQALSEGLGQFRLSILFDLAMACFDVAIAVLFFVMLRPVHATGALMAMVFRLVQASVIAANCFNLIATEQALAAGGSPLLPLARHAAGYDLGLVFFAVNCFLMAWLLKQAPHVPRGLALGIAASGVVYLAGSLTRFLAPELTAAFQPAYLVPLLSETALCLWLLFAPSLRLSRATR